MRKQIPKALPDWYWLVCIVLLFAALSLLLGCASGPRYYYSRSVTVTLDDTTMQDTYAEEHGEKPANWKLDKK